MDRSLHVIHIPYTVIDILYNYFNFVFVTLAY